MNLEKELQKEAIKRRKSVDIQVDIITSTNRLLEEKSAEDRQMIKNLGMGSTIDRAMEVKGRRLELAKIESREGQVFTIDEIKNISCKYALKFLRSDKYKGTVDAQLPQKIREFYKEKGRSEVCESDLHYRFYILAPQSAFNLQDKPDPPPTDPMMFYKIDENHYKLIHKWGADLTIWRRIVGWKFQSWINYTIFWMIAITACVYPVIWCFSTDLGLLLIPVVASLIWSIVGGASEGQGSFDKWEKYWNSDMRQSA